MPADSHGPPDARKPELYSRDILRLAASLPLNDAVGGCRCQCNPAVAGVWQRDAAPM
jgi:hypothetical protein